jgi:glycosyltransferase involved in cell wall biosynthesis
MNDNQDLLTICILTLDDRVEYYNRLRQCLDSQVANHPVRIITVRDNYEKSIGAKRNQAVRAVETPYMCFIDDDDLVSTEYIRTIIHELRKNPDAVGLRGIVTQDHGKPQYFINSLGYKWEAKPRLVKGNITYLRPVNHLNPIRTEIALRYPYEEINHAEDMDYANRLLDGGDVKVCPLIDKVMYFYQYRSKKF